MFTPYAFSDHGAADPNPVINSFLDETISMVRGERAGISYSVKQAVNGFGDNAPAPGHMGYKHHIPWNRILLALDAGTVGTTRGATIGFLDTVLNNLNIADTSGLDPQANRIGFDSWYSWVVETVCDWPNNIFRCPSVGGHGGTRDNPVGASVALTTRLTNARTALNAHLGVDPN